MRSQALWRRASLRCRRRSATWCRQRSTRAACAGRRACQPTTSPRSSLLDSSHLMCPRPRCILAAHAGMGGGDPGHHGAQHTRIIIGQALWARHSWLRTHRYRLVSQRAATHYLTSLARITERLRLLWLSLALQHTVQCILWSRTFVRNHGKFVRLTGLR